MCSLLINGDFAVCLYFPYKVTIYELIALCIFPPHPKPRFTGRQHVGHSSPCPPEAVARGAGGQRPVPGAALDGPGRDALRDPVEARHATHAAAGG